MQHFDKTNMLSLTFLAGGVKKKLTLHDEGGRGSIAKNDYSDKGGGEGSIHPKILMT